MTGIRYGTDTSGGRQRSAWSRLRLAGATGLALLLGVAATAIYRRRQETSRRS